MKPKISLQAKMTKLRLSYLLPIIRRQGSLGKDNNAGEKIEGKKRKTKYEVD